MTDWLDFDARVVAMPWGKAVYTVIPVPDAIAERLAAQGARRVEAEINDQPINAALSKAPVIDGVFLWAGKTVLDRIGLAPGECVAARLRMVADDVVDLAPDVRAQLVAAQCWDAWSALSAGKQRGRLYQIDTAKRPQTRAKRIAALIDSLRDGPADQVGPTPHRRL